MALGLLIIAAIPTTVGVCEALSQQKKVNNSEKEKAKFHLTTNVTLDDGRQVECWCVLKEGKVSMLRIATRRTIHGYPVVHSTLVYSAAFYLFAWSDLPITSVVGYLFAYTKQCIMRYSRHCTGQIFIYLILTVKFFGSYGLIIQRLRSRGTSSQGTTSRTRPRPSI